MKFLNRMIFYDHWVNLFTFYLKLAWNSLNDNDKTSFFSDIKIIVNYSHSRSDLHYLKAGFDCWGFPSASSDLLFALGKSIIKCLLSIINHLFFKFPYPFSVAFLPHANSLQFYDFFFASLPWGQSIIMCVIPVICCLLVCPKKPPPLTLTCKFSLLFAIMPHTERCLGFTTHQ